MLIKSLSLVLIAQNILGWCNAIKLEKNHIGRTIGQGESSSVVLDCPYILESNDVRGLVISWFFGDLVYPVYQWIPFRQPQALGVLTNSIDLSYTVSLDAYNRHRAIRIMNPTSNLTGLYRCKVSSFFDEKVFSFDLMVYCLPTQFEISVVAIDDARVEVSCFAFESFPKPDLKIYQELYGKRITLTNSMKKEIRRDQIYNISLRVTVNDNQLDGLSTFECHLNIPRINITMVKIIKYLPRTEVKLHKSRYSTSVVQVNAGTKMKKPNYIFILSILLQIAISLNF